VTFTASVATLIPGAGTATGSVVFRDGTSILGTRPLEASGIARFTTTSLSLGTHWISAVYSGDGDRQVSFSTDVALTISQAATAASLTSSVNRSVSGQEVTLKAVIAPISPGGGTPTGTVTFSEGTSVLATRSLDASGIATFTTAALRRGNHVITAVYSGEKNFTGSTSSRLTQAVDPAATASALTSSASPAGYRQAVTLTATVAALYPGAGTPTGVVMFREGTKILGSAKLDASGGARFTTSSLRMGRHAITAIYVGDSDHSVSSSARLTLAVVRASTSTSLVSSVSSSVYRQAVTFTATVAPLIPGAGTPAGTVIFKDGARVLGSRRLNARGIASFTISRMRAGKHVITVQFRRNGIYEGSTSAKLIYSVGG
jgi:hypothetical protein